MLLPRFQRSSVGVYADESAAYVAEVRRGWTAAEIVRFASAPVEAAGPRGVEAAVRRAAEQAGIRAGRKVRLAMRGSDTFLRHFEMPLLPRGEWASGIRFESRKYSPFPPAETAAGYRVCSDADMKTLRVAFAGARRAAVAEALAPVRQAGFAVESAEPLEFSILRAFAAGDRTRAAGCEMWAVAAGGAASVVIAKNGLPIFARHEHLSVRGEPPYEELRREVRLAVDYFSKYFKSEEMTRLVLCRAGEPTWAARLSQEFGFPVDESAGAPGGSAANAGVQCAAGAALAAFSLRAPAVDLLAPEAEPESAAGLAGPEERKRALAVAAAAAGAALAAVVLAGAVSLAATHNAMRAELAAAEGAVRDLSEGADTENLEALQQQTAARNAALRDLVDGRVFWTEKMGRLAHLLPEGAWLTSAEYADAAASGGPREMKIEGAVAPGAAFEPIGAVNRFVADIAGDKEFMLGFDEVKVTGIRNDADGITRFSAAASRIRREAQPS